MASFTNHITIMLLVLVLSSTVQIQARESKFFSKIFHLGATISPDQLAPAPAPTSEVPAPAPAPASGDSESQDPYYGLYGAGSGMLPPKETANTFENELLAEELEYEKEKFERNKGGNNYNSNGYSSSSYMTNGGTTTSYNSNGYNTNSYNGNGYESNEKQGMSDTRFVEGGKYYYDAKSDNYYPNRYESLKEMTRNGGYFGNTDENYSTNEFNSMDEFQNKEDQYQESQEDQYVP